MGYFSKAVILRAYKELSQLTNDPSAQGATQATSALRYIFALDEFTQKYNRDCDTSNKEDRDAFISFVGNVVSVNKEFYTANFFNAIKDNQDYAVGSNFFSVNVVRNSLENSNKDFAFPKRGNNPLFVVRGGHLIEKVEMLPNLRVYLHTPILRSAFAIWLVRFDEIDGNNKFSSITTNLLKRYSSPLIDALQLDRDIVENIANGDLVNTPTSLSSSDFPKPHRNQIFSSHSNEENVAIVNSLKEHYTAEELSAILKKMYDAEGVTGVFLFGLKFGKIIDSDAVKRLGQIVINAGISENYRNELSKALGIYRAIRDSKFGIHFYKAPILLKNGAVDNDKLYTDIRVAMRTKPFLLLAGISGTGKSRIVKQMAFDSCPNGTLRTDETSPGNYCLVEVKPNWHDSTELLGYESKIGGAHFVLTPFVKFLAKAMLYPEVPFFVCLDEMNLAPVEQYFAEFLSVLESRTKVGNRIVSEPLVKADIFKKYQSLFGQLFFIDDEEKEVYDGAIGTSDPSTRYGKEAEVYDSLKEYGLRIPENVVVIGTVNMDETTHQFSRKVIDRAMTIEMNLPEGNPFMDFYNNASQLVYRDNPTSASLYLSTEVKASDVVDTLAAADAEKTDRLKSEVARFLGELNTTLDGTPFKVAYRVQNELLLYFYQLWREDNDADWEKLLDLSCDQILMMKVLPRIEGDEELLEKPLERLASFCTAYPEASKKIAEMKSRLDQSHFASFWP